MDYLYLTVNNGRTAGNLDSTDCNAGSASNQIQIINIIK